MSKALNQVEVIRRFHKAINSKNSKKEIENLRKVKVTEDADYLKQALLQEFTGKSKQLESRYVTPIISDNFEVEDVSAAENAIKKAKRPSSPAGAKLSKKELVDVIVAGLSDGTINPYERSVISDALHSETEIWGNVDPSAQKLASELEHTFLSFRIR